MSKLSLLAQLVTLYAEKGITSTVMLAGLTGKTERSIWRAKAECKNTPTLPSAPLTLASADSRASSPPKKERSPPAPPLKKKYTPPPAPPSPQGVVRSRARSCHQAGISRAALEANFERWWQAFPRGRKKGRGRAFVDYERALRGTGPCRLRATPAALLEAARAYAASEPNPRFVPLPSTWLNQGRWLDDPEEGGPGEREPIDWRDAKRARDEAFRQALYGGGNA